MSLYQHILCVVDLSEDNMEIATRAAEMARLNEARLTLLHVVEYIPIDLANELVLPQQQEIEEQLVERAQRALSGLADKLSCGQVAVSVMRGSTTGEIIDCAQSQQADLIVIGRHGRHGISRLLGSTASAVLHHAPCDVLAVRVGE
jgi:universal stress protein A